MPLGKGPRFFICGFPIPARYWHTVGPKTNLLEKLVKKSEKSLWIGGWRSAVWPLTVGVTSGKALHSGGLPVISRVSSQGLKKDSPILECIYLSLFCVDLSIHLHLKTNSWAKHQCLSEHSIATQLFASCPMPSAPLVSSHKW